MCYSEPTNCCHLGLPVVPGPPPPFGRGWSSPTLCLGLPDAASVQINNNNLARARSRSLFLGGSSQMFGEQCELIVLCVRACFPQSSGALDMSLPSTPDIKIKEEEPVEVDSSPPDSPASRPRSPQHKDKVGLSSGGWWCPFAVWDREWGQGLSWAL